MYDNILYKYTAATGGDYYAEGNINGIERSYAKIAEEARDQYTLGYLSHESIYDDKYRTIDVRVDRPNVTVIAKRGYYPSAQDLQVSAPAGILQPRKHESLCRGTGFFIPP